MKRLSMCLTVLYAAGLPLTAAALDYGPGQRMLAAEASAPSLPVSHDNENPFAGFTASHRAQADDDEGTPPASDGDTHPAPPAHTARRNAKSSPQGAAAPGPAAAPAHGVHSVLSWQSLLPGSIQ